MRPSIDKVLSALGPAAEYLSVRILDEKPRRLARMLWRRSKLGRDQRRRIAFKEAAIRLAGLKGGAR